MENQGTNEDDSQSDPQPEAGLFRSQTTQNSGPENGPDKGPPILRTKTSDLLDMFFRGIEDIGHGHGYLVNLQKPAKSKTDAKIFPAANFPPVPRNKNYCRRSR